MCFSGAWAVIWQLGEWELAPAGAGILTAAPRGSENSKAVMPQGSSSPRLSRAKPSLPSLFTLHIVTSLCWPCRAQQFSEHLRAKELSNLVLTKSTVKQVQASNPRTSGLHLQCKHVLPWPERSLENPAAWPLGGWGKQPLNHACFLSLNFCSAELVLASPQARKSPRGCPAFLGGTVAAQVWKERYWGDVCSYPFFTPFKSSGPTPQGPVLLVLCQWKLSVLDTFHQRLSAEQLTKTCSNDLFSPFP